MFNALQVALQNHKDERGTHLMFVLDDAEGMRTQTLDQVRRLTPSELDGQHDISILLWGTDQLVRTLQESRLEPLCGRFAHSHALRSFGLEDARNYFRFHVAGAGEHRELFQDKTVTAIFHARGGQAVGFIRQFDLYRIPVQTSPTHASPRSAPIATVLRCIVLWERQLRWARRWLGRRVTRPAASAWR